MAVANGVQYMRITRVEGTKGMKRKIALIRASSLLPAQGGARALLADVRGMILETRQTVARGVNAALVVLHWNIGRRIRKGRRKFLSVNWLSIKLRAGGGFPC
jgi:hypothetical protein